jgi:micrococcal nuclease
VSRPWNPNKQTVELAPSRIRRAPPKREQTILRRSDQEEVWFGAAGVVAIAAVLALLVVGVGVVTIVRVATAPDRTFNQCYEAGASDCVVDGNTLKVAGETIIVAGMAAPRIKGAACTAERERGILAAVRLSDLLKSGEVAIAAPAVDLPTPGMRTVLVDGENVAEKMIAAGHAREDEGEVPNWCA